MTTFAVTYAYDERSAVRDEVRPEHRAWLSALAQEGTLLGSGPYVDGGEPGALLVFTAPDRAALDLLLAQDPFARELLIQRTSVRTWDVVLGPWSATTA